LANIEDVDILISHLYFVDKIVIPKELIRKASLPVNIIPNHVMSLKWE